MNKIVRDQYPVERLPEDLRQGLDAASSVRIVIELEPLDSRMNQDDNLPGLRMFPDVEPQPMSAAELVESIKRYKALGRPSVDLHEAVARIRALRDEWDD